MVELLLPAAAGAASAAAIAPSQGVDRTSAALAGTVVGIVGSQLATGGSRAGGIALGAAGLGLIAYDRWHDGLWPFTSRPLAPQYK